ncbi:hypothetical protein F4775DRAFT_463813 [Biscogniauxia sp. FL1348]|nr:hypothetical protein F4775DRAFT_463813 [Biscogniauxia sp. FL1348]
MGPRFLISVIVMVEDFIVKQLLRSPGFHRGVQRIHDQVHNIKYGRNPHEPLRQGEATKEPGVDVNGFLSHFYDELRNQLRGKPTNTTPPHKDQPVKK